MIIIFTAQNDLHALAIHDKIRNPDTTPCYIIECDRAAQGNNVSYTIKSNHEFNRIRTHTGDMISLSESKVLWLRRIRANQVLSHPLTNEEGFEIVNNDCRGALSGLLQIHFSGKWFSHPEASFRASDKLYQLRIAQQCGFRVPNTLVSQSFEDIKDFFHECNGRMIIKTVVGVNEPFFTDQRDKNAL